MKIKNTLKSIDIELKKINKSQDKKNCIEKLTIKSITLLDSRKKEEILFGNLFKIFSELLIYL